MNNPNIHHYWRTSKEFRRSDTKAKEESKPFRSSLHITIYIYSERETETETERDRDRSTEKQTETERIIEREIRLVITWIQMNTTYLLREESMSKQQNQRQKQQYTINNNDNNPGQKTKPTVN